LSSLKAIQLILTAKRDRKKRL